MCLLEGTNVQAGNNLSTLLDKSTLSNKVFQAVNLIHEKLMDDEFLNSYFGGYTLNKNEVLSSSPLSSYIFFPAKKE